MFASLNSEPELFTRSLKEIRLIHDVESKLKSKNKYQRDSFGMFTLQYEYNAFENNIERMCSKRQKKKLRKFLENEME